MKDFIKMVLAVICAFVVMSFLSIFLTISFIAAVGSASSSKPVLPKSGVLLMDMSTLNIAEQATEMPSLDPTTLIQGGTSMKTVGMWQAVQAINAAAEDPAVKYIFIKSDGAMLGISHFEELRKSLANFRASGKPVVSYMESPTSGSYYLASVSDKVYMTSYEGASTMLTGVSSQLIFLKDILDALGVNVQLIRHGKYKSAGEMYIRNEASEENLQQNQEMIDGIWRTFASEIAASRDMTVDQVNDAINNLKLNNPQDFLDNGFVDELLTREELHNKIADLAVASSYKKVSFIPFTDYIDAKVLPVTKSKKSIAVIYADGQIVDGSMKQEVAGDHFASVIAKVREDESVKAVVLRVNSPGGSVLAAEKIRNEIMLLGQEKPVVASYGDYAASGGYWISAGCEKIFSDASTLTGSIGVFSMIPDLSKTLKNVARINITSVNSNAHGDMYSGMRPLDAAELDYMQKSVEDIYDKFVSIVAEGRSLETDYVDSIAQGRVWVGADALDNGLVDSIGTLEDAIHWAASRIDGDSSLDKWTVVEYPKPQTTMEMLLESLGQATPDEELVMFKGTPFESAAKALLDLSKRWDKKSSTDFIFASLPYAIDIQ